jgi:hypothetical protein
METTSIVVDRLGAIAIMNGVLRIECMAVNAAGQEKASGTVLIPANVAAGVVQSLIKGCRNWTGNCATPRPRRRPHNPVKADGRPPPCCRAEEAGR